MNLKQKNIKKNNKEELLENKGYPDFFKDMGDFLIIVEAKDSILNKNKRIRNKVLYVQCIK